MSVRTITVTILLVFVAGVMHAAAPVVVTQDDYSFTLSNGFVSARVIKRSGDLVSLKYSGLEMLDTDSARPAGYWSHDTSRGMRRTSVTIDPESNDGLRGEVSVKGFSNGAPMGSGPGGSVTADIEIRYSLGRGDSGLYTYSILTHPTNYPGTSLGEARFCLKLNDAVFDWLTVDSNRNLKMITTYDWNHGTPMNMKEARRMNSGLYNGQVEHKYDYAANQFDVRAWGWSSTSEHVGIWFVNPSVEYLSGGPTKVELSAHRDATFNTNALNAPAPPTLLNYWRSSHYGGSLCTIAATDAWTKVIGPFLIYCNAGQTPDAMWEDALAKTAIETDSWPYDWVSGADFPRWNERGTTRGQIVLEDPQSRMTKFTKLLVGLSTPDYTPARINRGAGGFGGFSLAGGGDDDTNNASQMSSAAAADPNANVNGGSTNRVSRSGGRRGGFGGSGGFGPRTVDWQNDAKHYQFWVRGNPDGTFAIRNVRPGAYTLHAIADGVLGEFTMTNVIIGAGQTLNAGTLRWQPSRFGKQLWEIGIPNRSAAEFFKGDEYFHWGWYLQYPKLFPRDVNFVIGKSDFHKDWFFEQVPHNDDAANITGRGFGRSTIWQVQFRLPEAPRGRATLRLAICGVGARNLTASMNGQSIGSVTGLVYNATIARDGIAGSWSERDVEFDAALMKAGSNTLALIVPEGGLTSGILYDYLRLELDSTAPRTR